MRANPSTIRFIRRLILVVIATSNILIGGWTLKHFAEPNKYGMHLNGATTLTVGGSVILSCCVFLTCITPPRLLRPRHSDEED